MCMYVYMYVCKVYTYVHTLCKNLLEQNFSESIDTGKKTLTNSLPKIRKFAHDIQATLTKPLRIYTCKMCNHTSSCGVAFESFSSCLNFLKLLEYIRSTVVNLVSFTW